MLETKETEYFDKCSILSEFWVELRDDYEDLIKYCDLGFPLAYAISEGIVESTPESEMYINQTWDLLLNLIRVKDTGFSSALDVLESPIKDIFDASVESEDN